MAADHDELGSHPIRKRIMTRHERKAIERSRANAPKTVKHGRQHRTTS